MTIPCNEYLSMVEFVCAASSGHLMAVAGICRTFTHASDAYKKGIPLGVSKHRLADPRTRGLTEHEMQG